MPSDAALIDEIVGRVLRELGTRAGESARQASVVVEPTKTEANVVSIAAPIVTRDLLEGLTGRPREIRVSPKAILTPSARDYVRQHGVTVLRAERATKKPTSALWQVFVCSSTPRVSAALDALRSSGATFERRVVGDAREAATLATAALCRAEAAGVVVFSDQPEWVACLANRNEKIRGAVLATPGALDRLRSSFQPNLLAVNPLEKSQFELQQLLKTVVTGGASAAYES